MKKIYFYISILFLCILVWINKINITEGARGGRRGGRGGRGGAGQGGAGRGGAGRGLPFSWRRPPPPITFTGLSAENLYEIYKAIDQKTEKKKIVNAYASNAAAKISQVVAQTQKTMADAAASFEFEDSEEPEPDPDIEPPKQIEIINKTCPSKKEVIEQLIELRVNDDKFNELIDRKDKDYNKAYDDLMIQLQYIPTIRYDCRFTKKGHRTPQSVDSAICSPKCNCLKDLNMCKNYTYLQYVYNDQIDAASSLRLSKSVIFMYNGEIYDATDLDDLKVKLKEKFELIPKIPA